MADDEREPLAPDAAPLEEDEDDESASTPFDHPLFLPVMLWAGAAWFGYDIVTNAEAYQEWPNFNRGGFALLALGAAYFTWRGVREMKALRAADASPESEED